MIIGLDFDGVLAREVVFPRWLPMFLVRFFLAFAPEVTNLEVARHLGKQHRLVIITARPEECAFVTRLWLRLHRVQFATLHCVGLAGDKVSVLRKEKVEVYFDDKPRYVKAANHQGVTAHLFQSWSHVARILGLTDMGQDLGFYQRHISSSIIGQLVKRRLKTSLRVWAGRSKKLQALRAELAPLAVCASGWVGHETVVFKQLKRPIIVYHATSSKALAIFSNGLVPTSVRDQTEKQTSVVFFYLDFQPAWLFSQLGKWPFRLLFNFRTELKDMIVEVRIPAGTRIGITSWHEVMSLDSVSPDDIKPARS